MQPTTMLPKLTETNQTISFSEGDDGHEMTREIYATDVLVTTNAGTHSHGSSKVKLRNLVDYNWEPKLYTGQLLAVHLSGKYLAYCIKTANPLNPGTWCGMVRVVYTLESGKDIRALIKGMKGEVQDLAFAHIQSQVVLACIDEQGNFFVHEIEITDSGLRCTLIVEIREDTGLGGSSHRVVWCPYIPDEDDEAPDDDVARLMLTTHGNVARVWNVSRVSALVSSPDRVGLAGAVCAAGGVLTARDHTARIVDAAFSPDGTALATASADGYVMFFQVYMHNEGSPRCLHKWQPHGGKPLSCLFFLDNHKNLNTDVQFWKFAVTGAESNSVLKIWSCKSWSCLQTVTFAGACAGAGLAVRATLDASAAYLVLADYRARSLYVLNMARDADDATAYCRNITECLLPYPVLSFCVADADEVAVKCESSCDDPFHRNGSTGDISESPDEFDRDMVSSGTCPLAPNRKLQLRLYIVHPKGLQEGELLYLAAPQPYPPREHEHNMLQGLSDLAIEDKSSDTVSSTMQSSILQQQSQQLKNLLMRNQTQPGSLIGQRPESPAQTVPQLNLMTPDAFSSPGKREEDDPPLSATPDVKPRSSTAGAEECGDGEGKLISGGSSPSREVQEIMAHNDDDTFFKHEDEMEEEESSQTPVLDAAPLSNGDAFPAAPQYDKRDNVSHTNSDTSWPQISLAQITEANQRKASSDKSSSQSLNNSLNVSADRTCNDELQVRVSGLSPADKSRLEMLEHKLDKLCDLVASQRREALPSRAAPSPRALVDEALHAHTQRTTHALETALNDGWERISRVGEAASARAAAAAGVGAARALEPLAAALQHELAAKLSATDHLLRDNIEKLASSKTVMEGLSTSIAKSLSEMVRESFRAALFETVVPMMEKAHAQIFHQINHAFQAGTKEFAANTEAAARAAADRGAAGAVAGLRAALDRHRELLDQHAHQQIAISNTVKEVTHSVLEKELSWWREQARAAVLQSRAQSPHSVSATPAHLDRQMQVAQIQSLMSSGDMNGAFQLALSASDLALVVAACRAAEPPRVFGPPCKLKQHVLLSLVQQLAADMTKDTQLKHKYLEEAIMNLDTTNPVTREHLPVVIRELQKQVVAFLNLNPGHALSKQFKMLLMATDSLLKNSV